MRLSAQSVTTSAASLWRGLTQAGLKGHQLLQDPLQVCVVWAALGSAGMAHESGLQQTVASSAARNLQGCQPAYECHAGC